MVELTKLIVRIRGNLSKLERKVIVALVTTDVHARDIIDELYENKARNKIIHHGAVRYAAVGCECKRTRAIF